MTIRALVVAGARPNFMKVAPIIRALGDEGHDYSLLHTGQHYDAQMSDAFFEELGLPAPHFSLGVGSGSHAKQTARVMEAFEPVLLNVRPDWVVVVGDVNSTLACALVASKLREETGCRIAHVEAGLRSNDWRMPEEVNRVLTDRLSDLLLTPSEDAEANLVAEGLPRDRVRFVGNVMLDTLFQQLTSARELQVAARLGVASAKYAVATIHRPSNVDSAEALRTILSALQTLSHDVPVVLPLHPRTRNRIDEFGLDSLLNGVRVLPPLGYRQMLGLVDGSSLVLTDSGGLQEETTALGIPCVTLREQTERPVTITQGTNRLAEWPMSSESVARMARRALDERRLAPGEKVPSGWDGKASVRIVEALATAGAAETSTTRGPLPL